MVLYRQHVLHNQYYKISSHFEGDVVISSSILNGIGSDIPSLF